MKKTGKNILVKKASGELLPFAGEKLVRSLTRAGAPAALAEEITAEIKGRLVEGIATRKIYSWAFALLKQKSKHLAARYHLKNGIMELGPSGFPFEKFISEILRYQGYDTRVGQMVKGHCVNHEIDIVAEKGNQHFMIECKYHNRPGTVCDVKIPLYIQARFKDVEAAWLKLDGHASKFHQGWVVTNTRFTSDAIQYGNCAGLKLIGWDYPNGGSLRGQVDELGLYPITCLTTLTQHEKELLLAQKRVMCHEVCEDAKLLHDIGIKPARAAVIQEEGRQLCKKLLGRAAPAEIAKK
jgi:hypothetical protein